MGRDVQGAVTRRGFLRTACAGISAAALRALLPFGPAAAVLASCTEHRDAGEMARRLVIAISQDIRTLDPAFQVLALDGSIIANIMEPLTWYDHELRLVPRLATSWESPDGGMSWLFHLRRGVEFHDGTRFDATAVKFHFDRILDPVTKSTRLTRVAQLAGTDVVDEYTIRFRMKTPYSVWPEVLRDPFACIVSPAAARAAGDSRNFTNHPVGTGPFRFAEYIPDRYVLLRRNPSYWGGDVIKFEELMFKPVREPTTRLILLEQGQLDLADVSWAHTEVAERSGRIRIDKVPWLAIRYIGLNNQKPPFNDARVRRAANFAINRDDIVKYAFRGNCDPALGPLPPVLPVFNREMETFHYDPDRARALLREADYPKGYQAVMWAIDSLSDKAVAEIVQEQLRMAGIDVKVLQFDRAVYWDKFDAFITADGKWFPTGEGVFDMFIGGWVGGENAHGYLDPLFRSTSNSNNAFYRNDEVDRLLDESLKTTDPAGRDDIYRRLQAMIVADAPWIFAYHSRILMGMSPRVRGWHTNPSGEYELQNVFIDGQAKA